VATPTTTTAPSWTQDVLAGLGIKPNGANQLALALWAQAEGSDPLKNDWLNTSLNGARGRGWSYPTYDAGIAATVATLQEPAYAGIVKALGNGSSVVQIGQAINASGWCRCEQKGGCSGGGQTAAYGQPCPGYPATLLKGATLSKQFSQQGTAGQSGGPASKGGTQPPTTAATGCNPSNGISFGVFSLFSQCQTKALLGGLMVGAGGFMLLVGAVIIARYGLEHTGVGQAIQQVAPSPVRAASSRTTSAVPTPAPESTEPAPAPAPGPAPIPESRLPTRRRGESAGSYRIRLDQVIAEAA
jgi:hypothetical protein